MAVCAFIGNEISALGFRLVGAECHHPEPHEASALFSRLRETTPLIILTAELAASIPPDRLRLKRSDGWPLVLVVQDARGRVAAPDLIAETRRHLGMSE